MQRCLQNNSRENSQIVQHIPSPAPAIALAHRHISFPTALPYTVPLSWDVFRSRAQAKLDPLPCHTTMPWVVFGRKTNLPTFRTMINRMKAWLARKCPLVHRQCDYKTLDNLDICFCIFLRRKKNGLPAVLAMMVLGTGGERVILTWSGAGKRQVDH